MRKIFVEYPIKMECQDPYRVWVQEIKRKYPACEVMESVDQPGLFLEIWTEVEGLTEWKHSRRDPLSVEWGALVAWVPGAQAKIRIWEFATI